MAIKDNYNGVLQQPIGSGFNGRSTARDVINGIDLHGKTAIVTGGYAGIGLETVKVLAAAGAKVIVPARDLQKAAGNLAGITNVTVETMDLMAPETIDAFAERFLATCEALHILVNNAGIAAWRRSSLTLTWESSCPRTSRILRSKRPSVF
jgi:NAD(P)-dependent dehydrogenase (short-subunit alcohol dehydrogenase family)